MRTRLLAVGVALSGLIFVSGLSTPPILAQSKAVKPAAARKIDEEYTKLIKQNLQDPGITTELVSTTSSAACIRRRTADPKC